MSLAARHFCAAVIPKGISTLAGLVILSSTATATDLSGWLEIEGSYFPNSPLYPEQETNRISAAIQPELYQDWENGNSFTFTPFYRYDSADDQRTHFDVREAMLFVPSESYDLRIGIGKVFWGVTEAGHLVDIINQTDLIEAIDGEQKLGQAIVNLTLFSGHGDFDFFVLPYFRERTFPGGGGRLRFEPAIDNTLEAVYESGKEKRHVDYALRYSNMIGNLEIGLSDFYGTSREPAYLAELQDDGSLSLTPFYEIINQAGLDLQYVNQDWLWKLEAIYRSGLAESSFYAVDVGFEYALPAPVLRDMDLGLIVEYMYDSRDFNTGTIVPAARFYISSRFNTFLNNDIMLGLRLAANDASSSELLAGLIRDLDHQATVLQLQGSRRLGNNWKAELNSYVFLNVEADPLLSFLREDSFVQLSLKYYF